MKMSAKFWPNQWKIFSTTTGIKGFAFLLNAKTQFEWWVWLMALIAATIYTAVEVIETFKVFRSSPTVTKLQMISETPSNISSMKLCLSYKFEELKPQGLNVSSSSDLLNLLAGTNSSQTTNFTEAQLLYIAANLFSFITEEELFGNSTIPYQLAFHYVSFLLPDGRNDVAQLAKVTGSLLWCAMNLRILYSSDHLEFKPKICSDTETISWFGTDTNLHKSQLCLKVPSDFLVFHSRFTTVIVKFDFSEIFYDTNDVLQTKLAMLHLGPSLLISGDTENVEMIAIGYKAFLSVKHQGHYVARSSSSSPCYNGEASVVDCQLHCSAQAFYDNFGFWPLYTAYLTNRTDLIPKSSERNGSLVQQQCKNRCFPQCERKIYSAEQVVFGYQKSTELRIILASFIHPKFIEIEAISTKQFLAQLGGNLSLWIGASFLVLLHVIIFLLHLPFSYWESTGKY